MLEVEKTEAGEQQSSLEKETRQEEKPAGEMFAAVVIATALAIAAVAAESAVLEFAAGLVVRFAAEPAVELAETDLPAESRPRGGILQMQPGDDTCFHPILPLLLHRLLRAHPEMRGLEMFLAAPETLLELLGNFLVDDLGIVQGNQEILLEPHLGIPQISL